MKINTFFIAILVILFCIKPEFGNAVNTNIKKTTIENNSTNQEDSFNAKELEKQLGRELTLKEKLLLPFAKKQMKKQAKKIKKNQINEKTAATKAKGKKQFVALLLCIFLGLLGLHRFYLGYTGWGIIFLLTAGVFGIGWLIDLIMLIIPNGLTPKGQSSY